jgi:hypothetical protein
MIPIHEDNWFEGVRPEEREAKKRWDEEFDRPVAQCALEERIWEEQAAKEAELKGTQAGDKDEP